MHPVNAVLAARMITTVIAQSTTGLGGDIAFGLLWFFVYAGISCFLVLFAGIMSDLTLGLMSLRLVELEILQRSGTLTEKKQAATILLVVQEQHQLLVTLLLCNAVARRLFHNPYVLKYGLAVGANFVWLVRILMIICYPIAYPIGKIVPSVAIGFMAYDMMKAWLHIPPRQKSKSASTG